MNKLEEAREIINQVDDQMIDLFMKRMAAVKMVAEYKVENNIPVLDSIREDTIKTRNIDKLSNKVLEGYYLEFFDGVLQASKEYQKYLIENELKEEK